MTNNRLCFILGKTQLCLSCCAAMTLRGKGVVFIDTELKFDPLRLSSLVQSRLSLTVDSDMTSEKVLERVQVHRPTTTIDLTRLLEELESTIITHNVGLVVIDSVAALARHENLVDADRERLVVYWTALLKRVADLCHCCILVTNQVE